MDYMGRKPTGRPRGRPPKGEDEKAIKVLITLTPDALDALDAVAANMETSRSGAVAQLAIKAAKRVRA